MEKTKFTLRIEENLLKDMKKTAIDLNLPLNQFIEYLYKKYSQQQDSQNYDINK